jgi:hypothetical protein
VPLNNKKLDDLENSKCSFTISKSGELAGVSSPTLPQFAASAVKYTPLTNTIRSVLEPDSRKIQAERSALLKDLDKSSLLLKYKQTIVTTNQETDTNNIKISIQENAKSIAPNKSNLSLKLTSNFPSEESVDCGVYLGGGGGGGGASATATTSNAPNVVADSVVDNTNSLETNKSNQEEVKTDNNNSSEIQKIESKHSFKIKNITLLEEPSVETNEEISLEFNTETKLEIVEDKKEETDDDDEEEENMTNKHVPPRRSAFNPLHVILKDKNKYYTTEYI